MNDVQTRRIELKHAFTATAFGLVTIRNVWRQWFRGLVAERKTK